ncbi:UTRA domain-containing protein [Feifania hominis]|uniref:GntR family transcriptional regulator n=1 Tax=Feifania hominis TaxID=2763660 RepID=A0A926DDG6_9FIRM|nr:GntR family transcriptional regulator [Feifania hominis]
MKSIVDKSKPIPLYYQITEDIKQKINNKELNPGDKLPTEDFFVRYYGVSRVTVRNALNKLIEEKVIERTRGKGPVVANHVFNRHISRLSGLHEALAKEGIKGTSKILSIKEEPAGGEVAGHLEIPVGEPVVVIHRVRYADDIPICEQNTYLVRRLCGNFDFNTIDQNDSLYEVMERRIGLRLSRANQQFDIKMPTRQQMQYLEIRDKIPLMHIESVVHLISGEPIEFSDIYYLSDRYKYGLTLYR